MPEARHSPIRAPPAPSHQAIPHRPSRHPSDPDSHGASSSGASAALRPLPGSRQAPPSPTLRELATPDPAPYLASAPKRAVETPIAISIPRCCIQRLRPPGELQPLTFKRIAHQSRIRRQRARWPYDAHPYLGFRTRCPMMPMPPPSRRRRGTGPPTEMNESTGRLPPSPPASPAPVRSGAVRGFARSLRGPGERHE